MNLQELKVEIDKDLVSRKNDDGSTILMKMDDSETFYKIEGVAAEVWNKLSDGMELQNVVEEIVEKYDTDPSTVEADINTLLNDLQNFKLLKK
jgi:hypothetical protein